MGFVSGRVTFRRFRMPGFVHTSIDDVFLERLNAAAFGRYGSAAADGVDMGWITPQHLFDVDFGAEKIAVGRFAQVNMRLERNTPPSSILRSYFAIEQEVARDASGRDFLSKKELREAKDAAKRRAESEARSGAFRRITSIPVIIDLERSMLYVGTTSAGAGEKLQRLFADTFETPLEPVTAHELAGRRAEELGLMRAYEDAKPAHFIDPPDEIDADAYTLDPEDRGFFGREFLTWIWYTVENVEGVFELVRNADVAATLIDLAQLKCDFNLTGTANLRCDSPARSVEARAALSVGKQPVKLGLILAARAGEWTLTLDGTKLDVTGLVLPQIEQKEKAAILEARCESMADLSDVLDELFTKFVQTRLSSEWNAVQKAMRQWVAGRKQAAQSALLASA